MSRIEIKPRWIVPMKPRSPLKAIEGRHRLNCSLILSLSWRLLRLPARYITVLLKVMRLVVTQLRSRIFCYLVGVAELHMVRLQLRQRRRSLSAARIC
jgi:hypothetical protein